jgi:MFS family permease
MVSLSQIIQAIGYGSFFLAHSIPMVVVVMLITMFGERVYWVAFPTMVSTISAPGERDRWFAFTSAVRNAGLGLGGAIAAAVIWLAGDLGYQILLGADSAGFAIAAVLLITRVPHIGQRGRSIDHGGYRAVLRDRPAMTVAASNVVFAYCAMIIYYGLPVYVVETLDLPAWTVGFLFAFNTAQLALCQTLAIRAVSGWRRTRVLAFSGAIWIATSVLFASALALPHWVLFPYIMVVLVVYTVGELLHAPTATSLVASLAPDALRGRYISMVSLSWGIAQTIGPALFTGLLTLHGSAPWIATAAIAFGGALLVLSAESRIPMPVLRPEQR